MGWKYALADPHARKSQNRNKPSRPRLQHEAADQAARRRTTATGYPGLTTKGRFNPKTPKTCPQNLSQKSVFTQPRLKLSQIIRRQTSGPLDYSLGAFT
jgi:hypothetical protein